MTANQWAAIIFAALWFGLTTPVLLYCIWRDTRDKRPRQHR